jgi:ATP-binding cassette subfamily B (MDR/TAP) protein 1
MQAITTLIAGSVIGLSYAWKPALVGMGASLLAKGLSANAYHPIQRVFLSLSLRATFVWYERYLLCSLQRLMETFCSQRVVVLKDQKNKAAHESSAQLACEAAGAIRTVASLTREEDCLRLYSGSLEEPLRQSNRTAVWSNLLYSLSQSMVFFVISLIFWYSSGLVSRLEISVQSFFIALMVSGKRQLIDLLIDS